MDDSYQVEKMACTETSKNQSKKSYRDIKLDQPIDLRYKYKKGLLGRRKQVPTTLAEQRKLKKAFIQIYPDNLFIDDLFEKNSYLTEEQKRKCAKENRRALGEAMLASAVVDVACDFGDCGGDD